MEDYKGRTAIITGGASGIGRALTEELAQRGAQVTLADIDAALLEKTVASLAAGGYDVKGATLDVTDFQAVKKLVEESASDYGRLDYMFNNAGVVIGGEAHDFSYEDWHRVIDVNLYGVVHGVGAAYPLMVKQGSGHIVNTSSLAGLTPATGEISYTTSKYGIVGLSNALRSEGAYYGVKVSVVCPGFIRTPIYQNIEFVKLDRDKVMKMAPKGMPPEICARVILRGVERNKAIITVTAMAKAFWIMQRLSPALVRALYSQGLMKPMRKLKTTD
ncbi:MAG: SDR family oxidoreductase [Actinobacteria bacterium]|jgi:NAD(P)-dependent dehydrogenase (short-subunit alcohol dehydrogenase family)|nr:MAG: SDR family oxidoreductase [Actinomycetota bacterium]